MNEMTMKALEYLEQGYSPIPVRLDKTPHVGWKNFQKQPPTREQIASWDAYFASGGIGLITGEKYGIVVVDIDPRNGGNESLPGLHLPQTMIVKTGGGGFHYYYRWPKGIPAPSMIGYRDGVDIQGEGKYVVAPPSAHLTGGVYEFAIGETELAEAPDWLFSLGNGSNGSQSSKASVSEGRRNVAAASFAGKLLHDITPEKWEPEAWPKLVEWNAKQCSPSLPMKELRSVFDSISRRESAKPKEERSVEKTQANQIVEIIEANAKETFLDSVGQAYAVVPVETHFETLMIRSSKFFHWVARQYWNQFRKTLGTDAYKAAQGLITANVIFGSKERRTLWNRVAKSGDAIWYDMTDHECTAIKITKDGWRLDVSPPAIFQRHTHQLPQVTPISGGDLRQLLEHVNIENEKHRILLLVYIVSCFIPDIAHPIPILFGSQGSAKSTLFRMIRKIVDPSSLEMQSLPNNNVALVQTLSHHWIAFFDNVSSLPSWVPDTLCRAVTGEGFSKRALYTDDDDVVYAFRRCVGLNGINNAGEKPDLLDRSILFGLERIKPENRKDEETIWREFDQKLPYIVGAILDAISVAMRIRPTVDPKSLPRMADFSLWGCAIAEALGYTQEDFLSAYSENISQQNDEAIKESLVASLIVSFMSEREEWDGTMTELHSALLENATKQNIDTRSRDWPKAPNTLSRALNIAKTNLTVAGIVIEVSRGTRRTVTIRKTHKLEEFFPVDTDDVDDIIPF